MQQSGEQAAERNGECGEGEEEKQGGVGEGVRGRSRCEESVVRGVCFGLLF
ncbi:MAG: hypothetical protein MW690_001153 [Methanophagales archaeon]|nr:hypothetical protein [Methanophagales archaeon]